MELIQKIEEALFLLVLVFTIVPALRFIHSINELVSSLLKNRRNFNRWEQGEISLEDLNHLSPKEFHNWCKDFLSNHHLKIKEEEITILSYNNINSLDENYCKKLLGIMVHNNVSKGFLITTGLFNDDVAKFISKIPKSYNIELMDSSNLVDKISPVYKIEIRTAE